MRSITILLLLLSQLLIGQSDKSKESIITAVDARSQDYIRISDQVWTLAETALAESKSSALLADYIEQEGFTVERGVAEMPTAFMASYGSGKPIIGILAEFDALPGLSQQASPDKGALTEGHAGHGCGHNLLGVGGMGAAIAVKEYMAQNNIKGTVRLYGTPAEEKYFGKLYFARSGLFDDLDVCLDWHPSASTKVDVQSSLALVDFIVEFKGQAAHAAGDPWNGRSASDAMELFSMGINAYREHIKPTVRIHTHMQQAGEVVNVVPDYAKIWTRVRDINRDGMLTVYERVQEIARGAAIMADVDYKISLVSGIHEVLVNRAGGAVLQSSLEYLGDIDFSAEETAFANKMQANLNKPQLGLDGKITPLENTEYQQFMASSDVGDVSWIVPQIRLGVTTAPIDTPWHSWAVVACGGMSIGHKGMLYAAKALGLTVIDLMEDPQLIETIQAEFKERKGEATYNAMLPDGPPPIPTGVSQN